MSDLSRVEQLLRNALGDDIYEVTPQSRVEVLLQQLNELIEDIGGGSVDPEVITAWLAENIHDGAVIDSSLTVEGAAADSKKTGTEISQLKEDFVLFQDYIPDETQTVTFENGKPHTITHTVDGTVVRTDTITYTPTTVVETRAIDGKTVMITTNLMTLETEVEEQ